MKPGSKHIFRTTDTSLRDYNERVVTVRRSMTAEEADAEVGPMYEVEVEEKSGVSVRFHVFEDELHPNKE
jgi:hypothetical protein